MQINKETNLVLSNLHFYDFDACHYNILKQFGYINNNLEFENKLFRNINIGLIRKENLILSKILQTSTENLVNLYIKQNLISKENIIVKQLDGMIINKKLNIDNLTDNINYKALINKLIITTNRKTYITLYENGTFDIKGINKKPIDISFYKLFINIDYSSKQNIINSLDNIKDTIFTSNTFNKYWSIFNEDETYVTIPIKNQGIIKMTKSMIDYIDVEDIDREFLWINYIWEFIKSLMISTKEKAK